jgi:hypothetical protein
VSGFKDKTTVFLQYQNKVVLLQYQTVAKLTYSTGSLPIQV